MADFEYIIYEKNTSKMKEENSRATLKLLEGGLYLTKDGVIFIPGNTFLTAYNNLTYLDDKSSKVFAFDDIAKAETGSFKHLIRMIYTLRIHTKSGETHYFMMPDKERADKWTSEINSRR